MCMNPFSRFSSCLLESAKELSKIWALKMIVITSVIIDDDDKGWRIC